MAGINNIVNKIRGYVQKNPDKARQVLEKVEGTVNSKTGGKYSDKLNKASDAAKGGLGLPKDQGPPPPLPGQPPAAGQQPPSPGQQPPVPGQPPQPGGPPNTPGQPPTPGTPPQ